MPMLYQKTKRKTKRRAKKTKKRVTGWVSDKRKPYCLVILIALLFGVAMFYGGSMFGDFVWDGGEDDGDNTSTATTTTIPPTTTTTTPPPAPTDRYTFRVKWDYVAIMQIEGPDWLDVLAYTHPEDLFVDSASMPDENVWYGTINHVTQNFVLGDHLYIFLQDGDGWNFNLAPDVEQHAKYVVEVGVNLTGNLYPTDTDQDWGNFWLEWIVV